MKKYLSRIVGLLFISLLMMSIVSLGLAQNEEAENPVITATADGVTVPEDELVAGMTTLTLQNDTEAPFSPILARFNEGKTMDDLMAAIQQGPDAVFSVVTILGGPTVAPESAVNVSYDLLEGDYLVISMSANGPPAMLPFSVVGTEDEAAATPEALEADVEVSLVDFAFAIPDEMTAGEQVWKIANDGEQTHEMIVFRVDDDATLPDVTEALKTAIAGAVAGPPEMPYEIAFSWAPMSPGISAWVNVDLKPGAYAAVCFLSDSTSEEMFPHMEHGMIKLITVSE